MKKVLSIVLSIAMVVCLMPSMAFASADASGTGEVEGRQVFSDIDGLKCEGAVNVLNTLGVVNGFPDGTFRAEENVTRAHMAQMITKALNVETYANATSSIFSDMDAATWAIPQVEYCAQLGIIKGYGDGRFGPNDLVTYEQAATMLVRAVGYTDDCNEMISGVWPANYVSKALDLGIFDDTNNGGESTANRGDVALMIYNTLDLPQVYIDNDGVTRTKSGNEAFTINGENLYGTSMLSTLNRDGHYEYRVVSYNDIDNAIYDISDYFGTVAKVYENKDGDVLALGDIQTSLLTGKFNGDFDEFNTGEKTYTFSDECVKHVGVIGNSNAFKPESALDVNIPARVYENGKYVDDFYTIAGLKASNAAENGVRQDQNVTLAVKTSGSTITQVYSAHYWYMSYDSSWMKVVEDSDISPIKNNQKLLGKEFKKDHDGNADESTFTLVGVDSLDDIAADDVVAVYYDDNYIRRVEVGTERVEGALDSFSTGSVKGDGWGRQASAVISGTSYKTSYNTIPEGDIDFLGDMINWVTSESDDVEVGDQVKAYLDYKGDIYQIEQSEAGSSSYAMIMDYDISGYDYNSKGERTITNGSNLNGNASMVKLLLANGGVYTFYFKNNAVLQDDDDNSYLPWAIDRLKVGDIVTYELNSSNRIRKIKVKSEASFEDQTLNRPVLPDDAIDDTKYDITSKGYWNGNAISETATIFSIDRFTVRDDDANWYEGCSYPGVWIDDDDAGVTSYENVRDTDDVYAYAYEKKNSKIAAFVIDGDAVSSSKTFGFITSWTSLSSDHSSGCDYQVTALIDGESRTYYFDDGPNLNYALKHQLLQFKFNANGYISNLFTWNYDALDDFEGVLRGYAISNDPVIGDDGKTYNDTGITFRSGAVCDVDGTTWTLDSDVYYYEWKNGPGNMANSTRGDIESAEKTKYVLFYDVPNDDSDDPDKIIDIVIMGNLAVLEDNGLSLNDIVDEDEDEQEEEEEI
jgi:hypothetical protein